MKELMIVGMSSQSIVEPTEEDKRFINAVVQSGLTQLTKLGFIGNPCWFGHSEMQEYLLDFIQEQTCLQILKLVSCNFNSATTSLLFSFLHQSSNINTIQKLTLISSCDFSSDETCALLAQVVDAAPQLTECDIYKQVGERKINAVLKLATEGSTGQIEITD